jgi:GntR family transcriptional repressor for pyruvate dehydrogenase complex
MIQEGLLKTGDKLPTELQFAEQFEVSRGVVREALTQLQSMGYIRRRPKDGTYIQENIQSKISRPVGDMIRQAVYADLLDFRESLETRMVEIVIDRASDEEIDEIIESLDTAHYGEEHLSVDHYFHYKLAQASRNTFYMNFIDTYYDLLEEMAELFVQDRCRWDMMNKEHRGIAEAIARRDKDAARNTMALHMSNIRKMEELYGK